MNKQLIVTLSMILILATTPLVKKSAGADPEVSNEPLHSSPDALKARADRYMQSGDYSQAQQLYTAIITQQPATDLAFEAQKQLVILHISTHSKETPFVIGKFLADYCEHQMIEGAFREIAFHYGMQSDFDNSIKLYQRVLAEYPSDSRVMWAQAGLAMCDIHTNRDSQARAAIEKLRKEFSDHPQIAVGLNCIANTYRDRKNTGDAIELYQYVVSKYSSDVSVIDAQTGLAMCYIQTDRNAEAKAAIEKLKKEFSDHPRIAVVLNNIANIYRDQKNMDDAIELYQYVASKYPSAPEAIQAQSGLVMCYIQTAKDAEVKAAFEKLLTDFSNHQNIIGAISNIMKKIRDIGKTNIINQEYVLDNLISTDKPLQIQKTGLLFCIKYFDNKTVYDGLDKFMAGLAEYPDSADIINDIADRCHELKKHEIAVKLYQAYLSLYALESNKKEIELKLYESMYLAGTDLEKVLLHLEEYVAKNKGSLAADAMVLRGRIFAKLGEVDKAVNEYLALTTEYPETEHVPEASVFIGYCYILQGKYDQAKATLNRVIKDYPYSSYANTAKSYLARIESMTE